MTLQLLRVLDRLVGLHKPQSYSSPAQLLRNGYLELMSWDPVAPWIYHWQCILGASSATAKIAFPHTPAAWLRVYNSGFTWRGRGLSKLVISRVISRVTPFRALLTLHITYLLSPLPLQVGFRQGFVFTNSACADGLFLHERYWLMQTPTFWSHSLLGKCCMRYVCTWLLYTGYIIPWTLNPHGTLTVPSTHNKTHGPWKLTKTGIQKQVGIVVSAWWLRVRANSDRSELGLRVGGCRDNYGFSLPEPSILWKGHQNVCAKW